MKYLLVLIVSTWTILASAAAEVAQTFTVDGRLYTSTAVAAPPLLDSGVIKIQILSPDAACILYEENQSFNTNPTDGYFSLSVGSATGAVKRTASDSGNGMATVFSNTIISGINGKQSSDGSTNCTYTPVASAARLVRVKVTPVSDGLTRTLSPDLTMNSVPGAMVAERAETLQGISASAFLQLGTGSTTQSNIDNVFSATNYPRLTDLLSVGTGSYVRESANGAALAPTVAGDAAAPSAGQFWYDTTGNTLKFYNGSAVKTVGTVSSASDLSAGTIGGTVAVNTSGNIATSGNITASGNGTTTGVITGQTITANQVNANLLRMADGQGTPKYIEFKAPASIGASNLTYTWPAAYPGANMVLQSDNAGTLSWVAAGGGGSGDLKADGTVPMSANWDLNGATAGGTRLITGLADPSVADGVASKGYVDSAISTAAGSYVTKDGLTGLTGDWDANGATAGGTRKITGLDSATVSDGAATKGQLDSAVTTLNGQLRGSALATPVGQAGKSIRWNAGDTAWEYYTPAGGSVTQVTSANADIGITNTGTTPELTLNVGTGNNQIVKLTAAGKYPAVDGSLITALDGSNIATGTVADARLSSNVALKSYADARLLGSTLAAPGAGEVGKSIRWNAAGTAWEYFTAGAGGGDAMVSGKLSQFASTSSSELAGVINDESGSGVLIYGTSPVLTTPTVKGFTLGGATSGGIVMQVAGTGAAGTYTWPSATPSANRVLQSDNTGALSWVAAGAGTVTQVTSANSDIGITNTGTVPELTLNVGTGNNQIVKLTAAGKYPAVDGSLITALDGSNISSGTVADARLSSNVALKSYADANLRGQALATPVGQAGKSIRWNAGDTAWEYFTPAAGDLKADGSVALSADWDLNGATAGGSRKITGMAAPTVNDGAANKGYVDGTFAKLDGSSIITSDWDIDGVGVGTRKITGLVAPTASDGAATKGYVDGKLLGQTLAAPAAGQVGQAIRWNAAGTAWEYFTPGTGSGDALTSGKLSQFAATSSSELAGVISDETGSGAAVFGTSPTLTTPSIATSLSFAGSASGSMVLQVPATVSGTYTWPAATPASNMVLQSNNAGVLSWVSAASGSGDLKADGTVPLSANWDLNGATAGGTRLLTGIADPSANDGAATKAYVDSSVSTAGGAFLKKDGSVALTGNLQTGGNWISNDGGNEGLQVDTSGKVSVGGAAAAAKFTIDSDFTSLPHIILTDSLNGGAASIASDDEASVIIKAVGQDDSKVKINGGNSAIDMVGNFATGQFPNLSFSNGTSTRWTLATVSAEAGSNSGSDLKLTGRDDGGAVSTALFIKRSTTSVGIGSDTPDRLLEVGGAMRVNPSATPASPAAGDLFVDSTDGNKLKFYNGSAWVSAGSGAGDFLANGSIAMTGTLQGLDGVFTSASANALAVGPTGATNPVLKVNASAASAATGLEIISTASGTGVNLQTTSSGATEAMFIKTKGTGAMNLETGGTTKISISGSGTTSFINNSSYSFSTTPTANTATRYQFIVGADTSLVNGTEASAAHFDFSNTRTHSAGSAIALQRDFRLTPSTHAMSAASSITSLVGLAVEGPPIAGSNAAVTNASAISVSTVNVDPGTGSVTNSYGLNVAAATGASNNYAAAFTGGSVGVGTTAPTSTLDVKGTLGLSGSTSGGIKMQVASTGAAGTYTWPSATPASNMVLQSSNTGALSWVAAGGASVAGANTQIQYNNSGSLGADSAFTYTAATDTVAVSSTVSFDTYTTSMSPTGLRISDLYFSDDYFVDYGRTSIVVGPTTSAGGPAGYPFEIKAGNAYSSGTNSAGGELNFVAGVPTGTGASNINFKTGTASATRMSINNLGNISVGATAPNAKLDVKGTLGLSGSTSGIITFAAPTTVTSGTYVWPAATPASNMVLQSSNTGQLSWVAAGGGAVAGADTQVQFNSGGSTQAASADFTFNDTTNVLAVAGDITYSGVLTDTSDRRLKKDIKPMSGAEIAEKLSKINTYTFRMKDQSSDSPVEYGVMAQEVEEIFPELVKTAKDKMQSKSVNYIGFIAPMIETIRQLKAENESLKKQVGQIQALQEKSSRDVASVSQDSELEKLRNEQRLFMLFVVAGIVVFALRGRFKRSVR